ncbi:MAG: protein kinase [Candidatus Obscuribacterales bacterium]|nr:protein kinase [Candidatus Obscuribacterales bacterium]
MNEGLLQPDSFIDQILDGKYLILSILGSGAKGTVYKARHLTMDSFVAIKILHRHLLQDKTSQIRFKREAMITSQLLDPYIVRINSFSVTDDGVFYLVMEYLQGKSLAQCIEQESITSLSTVLLISKQIAKALKTAETMNIIHRDLKPANIFVLNPDDPEPAIKILDFGLAKIVDQEHNSSQTLTQTKTVIGSPAYMSPEQCMQKNLDIRSDIYSFGCVLYELLYGKPPIVGISEYETMSKQLRETPRFPAKLIISKELKKITEKCLAKSPDNRYQNIKALLADLDKVEYGSELIPQLRKRRSFVSLSIVLGLLLITVVSEFIQLWHKPEPLSGVVAIPGNKPSDIRALYKSANVSPTFYVKKGEEASRQLKPAEAIDFAQRALAAADKNQSQYLGDIVRARMLLVGNLSKLGRIKEALIESQLLLDSLHKYPEKQSHLYGYSYRTIGDAYLAAQNYKEANHYFKMAVKYNVSEQTYCQIYSKLTFIACENNNPEQALSCLKQSDYYAKRSKTRPDQWSYNYVLQAYAYLLKKDWPEYERSKTNLFAYLKAHPYFDVLGNALCLVDFLYRQKEFSKARALYTELDSFADSCLFLSDEDKEKLLKPRRQYLAPYRK